MATDQRIMSLSFSDIANMTLLGEESFYRCEPVDAEIERLEREKAEWSGIAAVRNRNIALIAEERDQLRRELAEVRAELATHEPWRTLLQKCEPYLSDLQGNDVALLGEVRRALDVGADPLDPTNNQFRLCRKGHVAYSVSFDGCPSCAVTRGSAL